MSALAGVRRRWTSVACGAALALCVARAVASPGYPEALQRSLDLESPPPCTLCHEAADADEEAATPFARSMVRAGLGADSGATLDAAIAGLERDAVDSDEDGMRDLDELAWGSDPNVADGPEKKDVPQPPAYGCALRSWSRRSDHAWLAALGMLVASRVRRRVTPPQPRKHRSPASSRDRVLPRV